MKLLRRLPFIIKVLVVMFLVTPIAISAASALKWFNSPRFWQLVAQTFPDYEERRKQLKARQQLGKAGVVS